MEVPADECVWFNLLLKPRTLEHLLKIPEGNRHHGRTKRASSLTPLWWSLAADVTTWRTRLRQTVPRAQDSSRRTTATTVGHPAWNIRASVPTTSPSVQQLKLLNGWESITLMTVRDDLEQRTWKEEAVLVWSPTGAPLCKLWNSVALFCTTPCTEHIHNTHTTYTQNTHREHIHSTCREHSTHNTHTQNLFHKSRVRGGPWSLQAAITKDHSHPWLLRR